MFKLTTRVALFAVMAVDIAFAQPPDTLWTRRYCHGPGYVVATQDQGWAQCGGIRPEGQNNTDGFIRKIDWLGNVLWSRSFGGSVEDGFEALTECPDGSLAFGGYTTSFGEIYGAAYVVKTDAQGIEQWSRHISQNRMGGARVVCPTPDNGVAVAGLCGPDPINGSAQSYLALFDTSGEMIALHTYGGGPFIHTTVHGLDAHPQGGWVLTGWNTNGRDTTADRESGWVLRVNANGDTLWSFTVPHTLLFIVHAVPNGDVLLGGEFHNLDSLLYLRLDSTGAVLLQRAPPTGDVRLRLEGTGGKGYDDGRMVYIGTDLNFGFPDYHSNAVLFMVDAQGDSLWLNRQWVWLEERSSIDVAGDPVTGLLWPNAIGMNPGVCEDYTEFIRFEGEVPFVPPVPSDFSVPSCYPNPFNSEVNLQFDNYRKQCFYFELYDVLGRQCLMLDLGTLYLGPQRTTLALPELSSGVYFGRLRATQTTRILKMVVIR